MKIMVECVMIVQEKTKRSSSWKVHWDVTIHRRNPENQKDFIQRESPGDFLTTIHTEEPDFIPGKIYQVEFNPT